MLYIPHGSDERLRYTQVWRCRMWLYIPHGSDESEKWTSRWSCAYKLYIPHGSDESSLFSIFSPPVFHFISHMVQMKEIIAAHACSVGSGLYIPHGSDESEMWRRQRRCKSRNLYIPHGSDESTLSLDMPTLHRFFISHMVQMKAASFMSPMPGSVNFISHMVQMKASSLLEKPPPFANFISHMVQMKGDAFTSWIWMSHCLYIPHGSDERFYARYDNRRQQNFISHMVQMKVPL